MQVNDIYTVAIDKATMEWRKILNCIRSSDKGHSDAICLGHPDDTMSRRALICLLDNFDAISERMPRPTAWAVTDSGGLTIEQRNGNISHLLRIGKAGKAFLTSFNGQEKIDGTLELKPWPKLEDYHG